jgi:hypothetical protein
LSFIGQTLCIKFCAVDTKGRIAQKKKRYQGKNKYAAPKEIETSRLLFDSLDFKRKKLYAMKFLLIP